MGTTPSRPQPPSPNRETRQASSEVLSSVSTAASVSDSFVDSIMSPTNSPGRASTTPAYDALTANASIPRSRSPSRSSNTGASSLGGDYVFIEGAKKTFAGMIDNNSGLIDGAKDSVMRMDRAKTRLGESVEHYAAAAGNYAAAVESGAESFRRLEQARAEEEQARANYKASLDAHLEDVRGARRGFF